MHNEITVWVLYDTADNKIRLRLAEKCKDYGLEHSQYSAFCGTLPAHIIDEFWEKLIKIAGDAPVKISLLRLCHKCKKHSRIHLKEDS